LLDQGESRGYKGTTLSRKQAMQEIQIPAIVRLEVQFIMKYCLKQGWKIKYVPDIIVLYPSSGAPSYQTQYSERCGLAMVGDIPKKE